MFHVEHSLSDAELAEQGIEHRLDPNIAGNPRQRHIGAAQAISDDQLVGRA
jgi:hypothetical protein